VGGLVGRWGRRWCWGAVVLGCGGAVVLGCGGARLAEGLGGGGSGWRGLGGGGLGGGVWVAGVWVAGVWVAGVVMLWGHISRGFRGCLGVGKGVGGG
jgi:hypothetical protein